MVIVLGLLKQCSYHGCTKILKDGLRFCEYHQKKYDIEARARFKQYSLMKRDDIENGFYNSNEWVNIRDNVMAMYFNIDILEYYSTGLIVPATHLHHIVEVKEEWNRRLDIDNLIPLTYANHRRVHSYYNKGIKERKQMQKTLFSLLDKFTIEFDL